MYNVPKCTFSHARKTSFPDAQTRLQYQLTDKLLFGHASMNK